MKKRHASGILAALALAAGLAAWFIPGSSTVVAEIGRYSVTDHQLKLRQAQVEVYYPGAGKPDTALAQLVQGYLAAAVLEARGVRLDRSTWEAENERMTRQSRDPDTLARVRGVFGDDEDNWLYVGVLPDFAQSRAFRYFRSSPAFTEEARRRAAALLVEAGAAPETFGEAARRRALTPVALLASRTRGLVRPSERDKHATEEPPADASSVEAAHRLLERLADLPEGAVYPNTLETPDGFNVVRLLRRAPEGAAIELVTVEKPSYGEWFWQEAGEIPVRIHDSELKEAFRAAVSWAQAVNLQ